MKKVLFILLIFVSISIFADEENILDYFPCDRYYTWTYANSRGIIVERRGVTNNGPKDIIIENQMVGSGSIFTIYNFIDNNVVIRGIQNNIIRTSRIYESPYPIELSLPGNEWQYTDRGDDLRLRTSRSSCNVDDTIYNDCILVEEKIVNGNTTIRTKKSYYARGIGLVLITLQRGNEVESIYIKLIKHTINN